MELRLRLYKILSYDLYRIYLLPTRVLLVIIEPSDQKNQDVFVGGSFIDEDPIKKDRPTEQKV